MNETSKSRGSPNPKDYEVTISDYIDVASQAEALGCNIPSGIALLPRNFQTTTNKSELFHESSAPTVRTLWRQAGITETPLESKYERFLTVSEHGLEVWVGPTILVTAAWLSQNPEVLSVGLGVISEYLADVFRGLHRRPKVSLSVVVEKGKGKCRRVEYQGSVDGLKELPPIIDKLVSND